MKQKIIQRVIDFTRCKTRQAQWNRYFDFKIES
jgi:hypothetical protein